MLYVKQKGQGYMMINLEYLFFKEFIIFGYVMINM